MPLNLSNLGTSIKLLFSGYLIVVAIGYGLAMVQILFTHGMADGKFGLSIEDIVYSYYGNRSGSVLEAKLNGSMKANAPDAVRFQIIQWVRDGADENAYARQIRPLFEAHCTVCHNADSGLPDFTRYDSVKARAQSDEGATFSSLTRVSHIHMFGIAFIFMFVGMIFALASGVPCKLKCSAILMPYIFLLLDIASWWLTKLDRHFALLVVMGGGGLAMAFVFMWVVSMYEMWILPRQLPYLDQRDALRRC